MANADTRGGWRQEGERYAYTQPSTEAWEHLRADLHLGQRLTGTVVWVPRPGAIGVGVDLDLAVGGFVDVLLLPSDPACWPRQRTTADFYIWWIDERPQIRLIAADPAHRREDFDTWLHDHHGPAVDAFLHHSS